MRTKNIIKHLVLGAMTLVTGNVVGQVTTLGNVAALSTDFLGWNSNPVNNFPLQVRHDGPYPIDFYTSGSFRARINEKVTYGSLNGFTNIPADGFTLITPTDHFFSFNPKGPFSRLHLAEGDGDNAQAFGYRLWQRNGITFTGNGDQGYVGQKYDDEDHETDKTDMVIQWSDNPGTWKGDRMRFIFTSNYMAGSLTGMHSEEGLEGMRLFPTTDLGINVGIGDYFAAGTDPNERLDVLDGRVRIRELPDDMETEQPYRVMVDPS